MWMDIPLGFSHVTELGVLSSRWGLTGVTEFAGVSSLPFSSDHLCVVEEKPRITEVDQSAQSVPL